MLKALPRLRILRQGVRVVLVNPVALDTHERDHPSAVLVSRLERVLGTEEDA